MKIAINRRFGGFGLSQKALKMLGIESQYGTVYNENFGIESSNFFAYRTNDKLIEVIEKLGDEANGQYASIKIVDVPDDVIWVIDEYHGCESIHEEHREWC